MTADYVIDAMLQGPLKLNDDQRKEAISALENGIQEMNEIVQHPETDDFQRSLYRNKRQTYTIALNTLRRNG